jgi:uncharacterized membrane protein YkvI
MLAAVVGTVLADIAPARSNGVPYVAAGIVGLLVFVLWLWALLDVLRQPRYAFEAAHVNRTLWIVLLVGSLFCGFAWLVAIVYLVFPRGRVRNQAQLGGGPGFPRY